MEPCTVSLDGSGADGETDSGDSEQRASQNEAREKARLTNSAAVLGTAIRGAAGGFVPPLCPG